ncbi:uncharacterized protein B0I36DRAFT_67827 [Microdochium trichocladiopsis]|uniref:Uncharacterized protein n=1 Tax=Microdochium trichocladiopsis TaxID=1682393 RepID=A0A9P8YGC0_9PEZI|nr:uncharacterized protein B0I36DRAFT_67827 [Microdochium trichocladiopsis]KAH7037560.1 hypothetical protein B0I36DRAFT_67827 [Microdochium trichocladiopsis]
MQLAPLKGCAERRQDGGGNNCRRSPNDPDVVFEPSSPALSARKDVCLATTLVLAHESSLTQGGATLLLASLGPNANHTFSQKEVSPATVFDSRAYSKSPCCGRLQSSPLEEQLRLGSASIVRTRAHLHPSRPCRHQGSTTISTCNVMPQVGGITTPEAIIFGFLQESMVSLVMFITCVNGRPVSMCHVPHGSASEPLRDMTRAPMVSAVHLLLHNVELDRPCLLYGSPELGPCGPWGRMRSQAQTESMPRPIGTLLHKTIQHRL